MLLLEQTYLGKFTYYKEIENYNIGISNTTNKKEKTQSKKVNVLSLDVQKKNHWISRTHCIFF
jgi:hypothetical protein